METQDYIHHNYIKTKVKDTSFRIIHSIKLHTRRRLSHILLSGYYLGGTGDEVGDQGQRETTHRY